jgi:hypothetical protein
MTTMKTLFFGPEILYNHDKITYEMELLKANQNGWVLNGSIEKTLNSLSKVLEKNPSSRIQRFILNTGDTFMYLNFALAHSTPANISKSQTTVNIEIALESIQAIRDVPITVCINRKQLPVNPYLKKRIIVLAVTYDPAELLEQQKIGEYEFSVVDEDKDLNYTR